VSGLAPTTSLLRFDSLRVTLLVSGGIAAYRAGDLCRELYRRGAAAVRVAMTPEAAWFITPLTLESLSRHPVITDPMAVEPSTGTPWHIWLAQETDVLVVLPATANTLAKFAHGIADELVSTTYLTFSRHPVVLAPTMNTRMWEHLATQANLALLRERANHVVVMPVAGQLACGEEGVGHLAPMDHVLLGVYRARMAEEQALLAGHHVVVTAGGSRQPLDVARVLTNYSSGKMGVALADAAHAMGARVTLIASMPTLPERPYAVVPTTTVASFQYALQDTLSMEGGEPTTVWMAAALADFEVDTAALGCLPHEKMKKSVVTDASGRLLLPLKAAPDVLRGLADWRATLPEATRLRLVGFAAETHEDTQAARAKLAAKGVDALCLNRVDRADQGFAHDENAVHWVTPDDHEACVFPKQSKQQLAEALLRQALTTLWGGQHPSPCHVPDVSTAVCPSMS
jgi:phosphopantothenoylcysteine decarboxylase / phosphopantothenate---cysteine ligase